MSVQVVDAFSERSRLRTRLSGRFSIRTLGRFPDHWCWTAILCNVKMHLCYPRSLSQRSQLCLESLEASNAAPSATSLWRTSVPEPCDDRRQSTSSWFQSTNKSTKHFEAALHGDSRLRLLSPIRCYTHDEHSSTQPAPNQGARLWQPECRA